MNCRVATCPHADCDWQKIRKDGRVVCAFLSEAKRPCVYRMTKNAHVNSDIQKGSSGYIIKTSSGVMKLGPSKVLESQILSGRVSKKAFERVDDELKKNGVRHGGSVLCGIVKSRKKNKLLAGSTM